MCFPRRWQKYKRAKPTVQAHFKSPVNIWLVKASHVSPKPRSREIHSTFCGRNCSYVAKGMNTGKGWGLRPKIQSQLVQHLPYEWSSTSGVKCRGWLGGLQLFSIWGLKPKPRYSGKYGRTSLVAQWLRLCTPYAEGLGSIPGQGTRSRLPKLKIWCSATNIWHSQIN